MRRRDFIKVIAGSAVVWPLAARAQEQAKVARIGFLLSGSLESPDVQMIVSAFRQALRQLGYVEGQNIVIEYRTADNAIERLPNLVSELVRLNVDLIVAPNTAAARAARQATTTIPIVAPAMADPVEDGLVSSLARPGGNLTGLTFLGRGLAAKRLQLLKDFLPTVSRVAILWHPAAFVERTTSRPLKETEEAARAIHVQLQPLAISSIDELDRAFATMSRERAEAVLVFTSPILYNERRRIAELALAQRLPSMTGAREYAEVGCLIAYGASILDLFRRGATYVDRIIKGAKPGNLPVEEPTKFELVINLRTAKALGIDVPPNLQQLADEVIE